MNRSFSPIDLVTVPRTSATSAMALGTALVTAAREEPRLPPVFVKPLKRLEKECDALRTSRQYQREAEAIDVTLVGEVDQQVDGAWGGLHGLLVGWAKLVATPEGAALGGRARAVLEVVFPDGLRFLNLPYRDQWSESQTKLDRLREPSIAEHVKALGGEPLVGVIAAAHERYGAVLHLTKRKAEVQAQAKVRGALESLLAAIRSYVLRIANYLDENEDDAEAKELGYALLGPLATWKSSGGGRRAQASDGAGDDGSSGDAPDEDEVPGGRPGGEPEGESDEAAEE
jgi:hypothetical protein